MTFGYETRSYFYRSLLITLMLQPLSKGDFVVKLYPTAIYIVEGEEAI
jgi:hypothetical protein